MARKQAAETKTETVEPEAETEAVQIDGAKEFVRIVGETLGEPAAKELLGEYRAVCQTIKESTHPTTGYMKRSGMKLVLYRLGLTKDVFRAIQRQEFPTERKPRESKGAKGGAKKTAAKKAPAKKTRSKAA